MNRRLIDPFQAVELPEVIEEYMEHGTTRCLAFNRRGTLLAAGTEEGQIVVWDIDTRGVAKVYEGHSKPVTCLCWSRNGRKLISGSMDQTVICWDVLEGTKDCEIEVSAPITHISLSRTDPKLLVVSVQLGEALLVDLSTNAIQALPYITLDHGGGGGSKSGPRPDGPVGNKHVVAIFNKQADTIICGQAKGVLVFLDATTYKVVDVVRIPNAPRISGLVLSRCGRHLLLNCHDRVLRLLELHSRERVGHEGYTLEELPQALAASKVHMSPVPSSLLWPKERSIISPVHSFHNVIDRIPWRSACFSGDSEHVIGAALKKDLHNIYIWNRLYGNLERILEGPRGEGMGEVAWHPTRSILTSVTPVGRVYLWAKVYNENWSAFAPDFKELDENKEYVEREDEFDLNNRDSAEPGAENGEDVDEEDIDIITAERVAVLSSDGEDDSDQVHYLPVIIEPAADPKSEEEGAVRLWDANTAAMARLEGGAQGEDFGEGEGEGEETGVGKRGRSKVVRWSQSDGDKRRKA